MKKRCFDGIAALVLIVFAAFSGAALSSVLPEKAECTAKIGECAQTETTEQDLPAAAARESVLLLIGYDGTGKDVGFLMLARIDPAHKTIRALQIPTESVPEGTRSAEKLVETVSALTDIGIDAYLSLDTQGFAKTVDLIGGISPDFPAAFEADGRAYPQGKISLDGSTAAALMCAAVRSDGDFDTLALQELILRETLGRIRTEFSLARAAALAGSVYPHVGTDLRFSEILSLVRAGMRMKGEDINVLRFERK